MLRLIGPDVYGSGARLNLGDSDYVYFDEDADDHLTVYAVDGTAIMGGSVGIGITSPALGAELHVDGDILSNSISTGLGWTEVHLMNQNVRTSDSPTFATINTGLGAHELYAMNQNVRTSDSPTFATINTGYGANELYAMNQNVTTTSMPTFARVYITDYGYALGGFHVGGTSDPGADNLYVDGYVGIGAAPTTSYRLNTNGGISATTLNTGNGNNELYAMNQNVRTTDAVSFGTINTGPGATEVYNMNQNVRTSDNVRFNQLSVGTTFTTHKITVANTTDEYVLRLMGPDGGGLYYGARLNFGDADYVYLDEDTDDHLLVHCNSGIMLGGAYVSVDNMSGTTGGNLVRWYNDRLYYDSSSKRYKRDIQPLEDNFEKILDVEPKSFIDRASGERNIGFIAEELADLGLGNLVIERDGRPDAIKYQLISVYLLEMIKEVKKENQELREAVEELRTAIN